MSVALLLCEGVGSSPDVRVLGKLLAGRCEVRPCGGKFGMGDAIKGGREGIGRRTVFGLVDGDFPREWRRMEGKPITWTASDGTHLGWRWERKEVENYLIDPAIVARALGTDAPEPARYEAALHDAREKLVYYQAARVALSAVRRRFRPLPNSFGRRRGRENHLFPDDTVEGACREGIRRSVQCYNDGQSISADDVNATYDELLPEFRTGGVRHENYLAAFAGKDILWAMDETLRGFGFAGALPFREKILVGMENTSENIGDWLAEWRALQEAVDSA
jgi:hypothetical protein